MRTVPDMDDKWDRKDVEDARAEPWMLDLLRLNPGYVFWGPHEDYMWKEGKGWDCPIFADTWPALKLGLDELNEVVNFYFSVVRESVRCEACDQTGYNPATKQIADAFYDFDDADSRWCDRITQDEVDALWEHKRLHLDFKAGKPTADEVNQWQRGRGMGHDGINRHILIETRAKRLGVYGDCAVCGGRGSVFTEDAAHVTLTMWLLHPRKGCSRGVEVKRIERTDLPAVFAFLGCGGRGAATSRPFRLGRCFRVLLRRQL